MAPLALERALRSTSGRIRRRTLQGRSRMSASIALRDQCSTSPKPSAPSSSRARSISASMCFSLSPAGASGGRSAVHRRRRRARSVCPPARAGAARPSPARSRRGSRSSGIGSCTRAVLQVAQPYAHGEDVHLPSGIVDVVLALDIEADRIRAGSRGSRRRRPGGHGRRAAGRSDWRRRTPRSTRPPLPLLLRP